MSRRGHNTGRGRARKKSDVSNRGARVSEPRRREAAPEKAAVSRLLHQRRVDGGRPIEQHIASRRRASVDERGEIRDWKAVADAARQDMTSTPLSFVPRQRSIASRY